jgi:LPXTG-motif cell wall-anchored protein
MKKITSLLIGGVLLGSTLLSTTPAFAYGMPTSCEQYGGRHNITSFEPDFNVILDHDRDGIICELKGTTTDKPKPTVPAAPGASDTKGNGGDNSSKANPNSQNSHNTNGNKELANTGADASFVVWLFTGLLALITGAVLVIRTRRKA